MSAVTDAHGFPTFAAACLHGGPHDGLVWWPPGPGDRLALGCMIRFAGGYYLVEALEAGERGSLSFGRAVWQEAAAS